MNVGHWAGLVPGNAGDHALLQSLLQHGALGFKAFMSPSGLDDFPNVAAADIAAALPLIKRKGAVLYVHAEVVSPLETREVSQTSETAWDRAGWCEEAGMYFACGKEFQQVPCFHCITQRCACSGCAGVVGRSHTQCRGG